MKYRNLIAAATLTLLASRGFAADAIPDEFRDPETGARMLHLSRTPNDRSGVIYFTQGSATADSQRVLVHTQTADKWRYLYSFDFKTSELTPLVTDRRTYGQDFSPRTNNVYYQTADNGVWSVNFDTKQTRKIADLPKEWSAGSGLSVNADDTLLAGSTELNAPAATQPANKDVAPETARLKSMGSTFNAHRDNLLFTVDIKSGKVSIIHKINTWLGHVQFSPTDPGLLMYCHEGPWEKVDRIWTIRMGETEPKLVYPRTEPQEIAGHEFWGADGKTAWFQNTFRDQHKGYLASKDLVTGKLTKYLIPPEGNAIHQAASPDGHYFIGDGGGKAATGPTKYLTVQIPHDNTLVVDKICSLQANDYSQCEPNPHLTPDQHWCIFTATLHGTPQAYAVEMPAKYWRYP